MNYFVKWQLSYTKYLIFIALFDVYFLIVDVVLKYLFITFLVLFCTV